MQRGENIKFIQGRVIALAITLMSIVMAAEFTAFALHYSPHLGKPIFQANKITQYFFLTLGLVLLLLSVYIGHKFHSIYKKTIYVLLAISLLFCGLAFLKIYNPFLYFFWVFEWSDLTPSWIWWISVSFIITGSILSIIAYKNFIHRQPKKISDIHGSAQFADFEDVKKTGLLETESLYAIYVGAWQSGLNQPIHYLRHTGEGHAAVFAPSRSGKGTAIIIPNLLSYQGNVFVLDLKLENYHYTSGYRKSLGQSILKIDFTCTDGTAACFNPLLEVRKGIHEIKDIQNIVDMIADPDGKGRSDHWTETANDLMVAVILHVLYVEPDKSLTGVRNFMSPIGLNEKGLFEMMLNTIHDPDGVYGWKNPQTGQPVKTHPVVAASARDMLSRGEGERTGIPSTLKRFLKLYRDPIIAKNTSTSDFKLAHLLDPQKRMSIYINMPPPDNTRLRPLLRLFINQMLGRLTETWVPRDKRHQTVAPTLLIMDEFPQLGYLKSFESSLAYTAGYGLRTLLICQDLSQIYDAYGNHESITSNSEVLTIYAPNKLETAKHFSQMLGEQTVAKNQTNYSGHRTSPTLSHINTSEHEYKRALFTPDELRRLPFDESIIFKTGHRPIHGKKVMYMQDPVFYERSKIPPIEISDKILFDHGWNYIQKYQSQASMQNSSETLSDTHGEDSDENFDLL